MRKKLTLVFMSLLLFCSCNNSNNKTKTDTESENIIEVTSTNNEQSIVNENISQSEKLDVLFIGNSLTYEGEIPEVFTEMVVQNNFDVNVIDRTKAGYKLSQHYNEISLSKDDYIDDVDIIIFQEYGSGDPLGLETARYLKDLMSLFNPQCRFFFMMTEAETGWLDTYKEFKNIENLNFILTGLINDKLLKSGFTFEQLHKPNDYHPNYFYGYLSALAIFSTVSEIPCADIKYTLNDKIRECVTGETESEIEENIAFAKRVVGEIIAVDGIEYLTDEMPAEQSIEAVTDYVKRKTMERADIFFTSEVNVNAVYEISNGVYTAISSFRVYEFFPDIDTKRNSNINYRYFQFLYFIDFNKNTVITRLDEYINYNEDYNDLLDENFKNRYIYQTVVIYWDKYFLYLNFDDVKEDYKEVEVLSINYTEDFIKASQDYNDKKITGEELNEIFIGLTDSQIVPIADDTSLFFEIINNNSVIYSVNFIDEAGNKTSVLTNMNYHGIMDNGAIS